MKAVISQLLKVVPAVRGGIASKTLHQDSRSKTILFCFDQGQQLSRHTSSMAASMQILKGRARVQLGDDWISGEPGTWIHMPPRLPHAIQARTRLFMLLTLFQNSSRASSRAKEQNS